MTRDAWQALRRRLANNMAWHQRQRGDAGSAPKRTHHDSCAHVLGWALDEMSAIEVAEREREVSGG